MKSDLIKEVKELGNGIKLYEIYLSVGENNDYFVEGESKPAFSIKSPIPFYEIGINEDEALKTFVEKVKYLKESFFDK